jgi:uncharacterized protein YkwD
VIRHRVARWLLAGATGLTLIGCQQGTEPIAAPRAPGTTAPVPSTTVPVTEVKSLQASAPVTTEAPAPPDPVPAEFVAPWEPPTTTSTTTTTTTEAPPVEPAVTTPARTVRPAAVPAAPEAPAQPVAPPVDGAGAASLTALTNDVRASAGLAPLGRDGSLDALAIDWARELASSGRLRHSSIPKSIIGKPWTSAGENVGFGPSVNTVHSALVASAGHYANIVGTTYTRIGVGVATDSSGQVWVVEVFAG